MPANTHLLALWNPAYATNAMERHLQTLLSRIRQARDGEIDHDDVYVWWGKVRPPHRVTLGHLTLGELARVLGDPELTEAFMHWMNADDFKWFSGSLPVILKELADTRNAAAHSSRVDRDTALQLRERALGVGCEGELARLGKIRLS